MRFIFRLFYRFLWALFLIFPIQNNKAVFQSFSGRGFSDNPKYIALELIKKAPEINIYWAGEKKQTADLPDGIQFVKYKSVKYLFHKEKRAILSSNMARWARTKKS